MFYEASKNVQASWFGISVRVDKNLNKRKVINILERNGIETRPIISGNFINQPAVTLYKLNKKNEKFKNAQIVENLGFFIGLHTKKINSNLADYISSNLLMINEI